MAGTSPIRDFRQFLEHQTMGHQARLHSQNNINSPIEMLDNQQAGAWAQPAGQPTTSRIGLNANNTEAVVDSIPAESNVYQNLQALQQARITTEMRQLRDSMHGEIRGLRQLIESTQSDVADTHSLLQQEAESEREDSADLFDEVHAVGVQVQKAFGLIGTAGNKLDALTRQQRKTLRGLGALGREIGAIKAQQQQAIDEIELISREDLRVKEATLAELQKISSLLEKRDRGASTAPKDIGPDMPTPITVSKNSKVSSSASGQHSASATKQAEEFDDGAQYDRLGRKMQVDPEVDDLVRDIHDSMGVDDVEIESSSRASKNRKLLNSRDQKQDKGNTKGFSGESIDPTKWKEKHPGSLAAYGSMDDQ